MPAIETISKTHDTISARVPFKGRMVDLGVIADPDKGRLWHIINRRSVYKSEPEWAAHQRVLAGQMIRQEKWLRPKLRMVWRQRLVLLFCPRT